MESCRPRFWPRCAGSAPHWVFLSISFLYYAQHISPIFYLSVCWNSWRLVICVCTSGLVWRPFHHVLQIQTSTHWNRNIGNEQRGSSSVRSCPGFDVAARSAAMWRMLGVSITIWSKGGLLSSPPARDCFVSRREDFSRLDIEQQSC